MNRLLAPTQVWIDGALQDGLAVELSGRAIAAIRPLKPGETPDLRPHVLMPACTDLQVNGSGGVMLNSQPTVDGIAAIVAAQRGLGTGWVMPTLITDAAERMEAVADAMLAAWGLEGLLGIHIEGPHINPIRKGTHEAAHIRPMDERTFAVLERLRAAGIPVLLTLAPEIVGAAWIERIADLGVVVSAGHSMATADEARVGLEAGARCFTHLYNAMPQMTSREPGIAAAAINSDAYVGIIVDGHHVSWDMVALAWRARPTARRLFMVSDAMATVGGPDHFELYGRRIEVRGGKLVNAEGSLAGAHVDQLTGLANAVTHVGLPLAEAIAMVTDVPHEALRLTPPRLEVGTTLEEMVALDEELRPVALEADV
ncbi:N-acetylglucosamine-6-phosphate deacetylase [Consotaella aegiceratis]|uniref:N-acetylglucosamine-6-phosphate deacetylase n=1 Tax=Consotaella aegiceratis TaxID=3097961 RepID=UPI002F3E3E22